MPKYELIAPRTSHSSSYAPSTSYSSVPAPQLPSRSSYSPEPSYGPPRRTSTQSSLAPRSRQLHHLSEGESDSESPNVVYRALRPDERSPERRGLYPPDGYNSRLSASQHITAGSRANEKSEFISASRSRKVASSWAAKPEGQPSGRVVKIIRPDDGRESYDMTNPRDAARVFPSLSGSSYNTAKASQEVVMRGHIEPRYIAGVYDAHEVPMSQYSYASHETVPGFVTKSRSRTTASSRPKPVVLTEHVPSSRSRPRDFDVGTIAPRRRDSDDDYYR